MRLLTFIAEGWSRVGLEVGGRIIDLAAAYESVPTREKDGPLALPGDMLAFLWGGDLGQAAARQVAALANAAHARGEVLLGAAGQRAEYPAGSVRIAAPIARPGKIICLGLNYAEHAVETGHSKPAVPVLFAKYASSIVGPGDPIVLPKVSSMVDYEAEMAVVIGRVTRNVSAERAYDYVAGYTIMNDISARDLQSETSQWFRGKSPDTFAPLGPYLVTKDEVPDAMALDIRLWLNGELMQSSNTRNLIFDLPFLIEHISRTVTLEPGDIISTGTPSGVGMAREPKVWLKPGDLVKVAVAGLGVLENPVIAEA